MQQKEKKDEEKNLIEKIKIRKPIINQKSKYNYNDLGLKLVDKMEQLTFDRVGKKID